jgi:hypothetical protein
MGASKRSLVHHDTQVIATCARFQHVNMLQMLSCTRISIFRSPKECEFGIAHLQQEQQSQESQSVVFQGERSACSFGEGLLWPSSSQVRSTFLLAGWLRGSSDWRHIHDATRCHRGWHWSSGQRLVESEASTDPVISVRYGSAEGSKPVPNSGRCGIKIQDCSY